MKATGAAAITAMAGILVPAVQAQQRAQPDAPDAGGFLRLGGWAVCVPAQEWAQHGQWVLDGVMAALQPVRWHTWSIWPATNTPNRIPGVFSDTYFDRQATRQHLADHPGCEWIGFNEPDVGQAMTPELAVDVTLEFVQMGREVGNDFLFMSPSITLDTSNNGLQWLTEYMSIMRRKNMYMRPSSWGVHPYNCSTVDDLRQSMRKWWAWWDVWGSGAPTIITEVCAQGEDIAGQILVMDECKAMLQRREVAGVAWASAYKGASDGTNWMHYALTTLNVASQIVTLTDLGRHWKGLQ